MQKLNTQNFGQTWSICSHLSPECLCMFDEGGSTEVELPLAYYSLHGRDSGQGRGGARPSQTEHRRQIKILRNQLNSQLNWRHLKMIHSKFNNVN